MVRGVSEVGDDLPGDDFADGGHVLLGDPHDPHGLHRQTELLGVVRSRDRRVAITQERVRLGILQDELLCKSHKKNRQGIRQMSH